MDASFSPELRAAVAFAAMYCRQQSCNGNIQVLHTVEAVRTLGVHVVGAEEFDRWERWVVPGHMMVQRALEGGEPG